MNDMDKIDQLLQHVTDNYDALIEAAEQTIANAPDPLENDGGPLPPYIQDKFDAFDETYGDSETNDNINDIIEKLKALEEGFNSETKENSKIIDSLFSKQEEDSNEDNMIIDDTDTQSYAEGGMINQELLEDVLMDMIQDNELHVFEKDGKIYFKLKDEDNNNSDK